MDFKKFERTMIWKEFWYGSDIENNQNDQIFKSNKSNLPKKYKTPNGLKTCLSAVKSEILDPLNRNIVKCNLPAVELKALKQLIQLQKERQIVIKPCDEGAGVIILDFQDYMKSCQDHLNSQQQNTQGESKSYYNKIDPSMVDIAKRHIKLVLEEGYDNNFISKDEYNAMCPDNKHVGKF